MSSRIVAVDNKNFDVFWEFVHSDILDYFFFIFDWVYYKDRTKFYLYLENDEIQGVMLIYNNSIVQLRGSTREVILKFIDKIPKKHIQITVPIQYQEDILRKINVTKQRELILMYATQESIHLFKTVRPHKLGVSDIQQISILLKEAFGEDFRLTRREMIEEF
jgi:hypothetical protein